MPRLSDKLRKLEDKTEAAWIRVKPKLPKYTAITIAVLYFYGMFIRFLEASLHGGTGGAFSGEAFTWDPASNLRAVFTPYGLGITLGAAVLYCLFTKKGLGLLPGRWSVMDKERGLEILPEGTHGTSGWMGKKEMENVLQIGRLDTINATLFGRLDSGEYIGMKDLPGMSKNIMVYGAPGTGKSRGVIMPFILNAARRGESLVICDSKAEFYEMYSELLREQGYFVRSYNLLDLEASDGWNCLMDSSRDINLVQHIAEIIIRNTSADSEREDFWSKAEKNLLMALIHFVQSMTYPGTNTLLPPEERSLGTIYRLLASTSVNELDARFRALPPGHPALPPYGIFRQAPHNIWGNIMIGLGSRLNVFQNKLADSITKYSEIDLEEPGRRKCAYFCIISDQDDTYRFLSSMFFSLLFIRLFDFARKSENRRLPVRVNVVMDEFCNIDLPNSKKYLSVSRSRNIDIQCVAQSVSQLADRYPRTEWQELVGDCDYQLFLGCNDAMTAEYISDQCGKITVRVNNTSIPTAPLAPGLRAARAYTESKISTGRPLMMPDEVRRLPRDKAILLVRGSKPLLLNKIRPEEHPDFQKLRYCKAADHIPVWRTQETKTEKAKPCASDAQSSAPLPRPMEKPPAGSGKEEYRPDADELDLHPPFDFSRGIDCQTLTEVSPKDL